jgi:hypothetical protein
MSKIAPGRLKMINKVADRYASALIESGRFHGHTVFVCQHDGAIVIDGERYRISQINAMRRELEARLKFSARRGFLWRRP